ncbi:MAG: nucleotidyl transferase AbiEii/AbiGii toxin family protein [Caldiserica bacterium]|nr:nucleotidyl transferase AbiEii/AbiGii toxin family protein [Caldisericota bacterium]
MHPECLQHEAARLLPVVASALQRYSPVLAGGTALALHVGHRVSVDFDFFTGNEFDPAAIVQAVQATSANVQVLKLEQGTAVMIADGVKVSLFQYPYPFAEPMERFSSASVASTIDIAGMKLIAIMQRGARRDFVDLYTVLRTTPFRVVAHNAIQRFGTTLIEGKPLQWSAIKHFFRSSVPQFVLDLEAERGGG